MIDELVVGNRALARAQAWCAALMMEFAETRSVCDRRVIAEREAAGVEARYKAGEFAGLEISMALRESKYAVQRTMVVAGGRPPVTGGHPGRVGCVAGR